MIEGMREFNCAACGRFRISIEALWMIASLSKGKRTAVLARVEERSKKDGSIPTIVEADVEYEILLGH